MTRTPARSAHRKCATTIATHTAAVLAAALVCTFDVAVAAPTPAEIELSSLLAENGGTGARGTVLQGQAAADASGTALAGIGDFNGDGMVDFAVGAPAAGAGTAPGRVYVVFGDAAGFPAELDLASLDPANGGDGSGGFVIEGSDDLGEAGTWVAPAGDINGDGLADVALGAPLASPGPGRDRSGEAYVVFGSAEPFAALLPLAELRPENGGDGSRGVVFAGVQAANDTGNVVDRAGDVNADGIDDLLIAAPLAPSGGDARVGRVFVVFGRSAFPPLFELITLRPERGGDGSEGFIVNGGAAGDRLGASAAAAGDVNADGIDDIVIGATTEGTEEGLANRGSAYVLHGRDTTPFPAELSVASLAPENGGDGSAGTELPGIDAGDTAGVSVDGIGDVNGDGIDDLLIGARRADRGGDLSVGEAYVVFGAAGGLGARFELASLLPTAGGDGTAGFVLRGADADEEAGASVSRAGDVDGDGLDDLILGAPAAGPGLRAGAGRSYVLYGRTAGYPAVVRLDLLLAAGGGDGEEGFALNGIAAADAAGTAVADAGDVDDDGLDDVLVGAPAATALARGGAGQSYLVYGRASVVRGVVAGLDAAAFQCSDADLRRDGGGPLADEARAKWSCPGAGVPVRRGDAVSVRLEGTGDGATLAGLAFAFADGASVECANADTGEMVVDALGVDGAFDCAASGLAVGAGEAASVVVSGTAALGRPRLAIATMEGIDTRFARCRNLDRGETVTVELPDRRFTETFDCEAEGVTVHPDDQIRIQFKGTNFGTRVEGALTGLGRGSLIRCTNETAGGVVTVSGDETGRWDCVAGGFVVANGDRVDVLVSGRAEP